MQIVVSSMQITVARNQDRRERLQVLLSLVLDGEFRTQDDLVKGLEGEGYEVTQSSVSRDIRDLGLGKHQGVYVAPKEMLAGPAGVDVWGFVRAVTPAGDNMVVIKTLTATAQAVAAAVDEATWHGIVGTVAGDDTVFVAVDSAKTSTDLQRRIRVIADLI